MITQCSQTGCIIYFEATGSRSRQQEAHRRCGLADMAKTKASYPSISPQPSLYRVTMAFGFLPWSSETGYVYLPEPARGFRLAPDSFAAQEPFVGSFFICK